MNVLVTGGAGYIGSQAVRQLIAAGHKVFVLDDLSHGHRAAVSERAAFVRGGVGDVPKIRGILAHAPIDAVIHFAGFIEVAESMSDPAKYYHNNFVRSHMLLRELARHRIGKIIFSSTAAVYGKPTAVPIREDHRLQPINPYGRSKMMLEFALEDFKRAYGLDYTILRYFNVAGASADGAFGEAHEPETHLIPKILAAARDGSKVRIFGTDYPTRDGTCIRDYIHVEDLVTAHILALNGGGGQIYNLGSEHGFSVREVIAACEQVTGRKIAVETCPRRPGDPPVLVASSEKIRSALGWRPRFPELRTLIEHAWTWHSRHPAGYQPSQPGAAEDARMH